jgi:hypothetical protein
LLFADSVRATSSRLREEAVRTISLMTTGLRMNMTALNQADHCIIAQPPAGAQPLPTVSQPNQVLDAAACGRQFPTTASVGTFLVSVLAANADQLGGTLAEDSFTAAELVSLSQLSAAKAISHVNATQVVTTKAYQFEAARLAAKRGSDDPTAVALNVQGRAGAQTSRLLAASAETVIVAVPTAPPDGSSISGRLVNDRGQGMPDYSIELLRANGTRVTTVGLANATGYFSAIYDEAQTEAICSRASLTSRAKKCCATGRRCASRPVRRWKSRS